MRQPHLAVYLNDHLAGATAALELLAELAKSDGLAEWANGLRAEIAEDREELKTLMRRADVAESTVRQAAAWVTEKLAELKTRLDDRSGGALQRFELIEGLSLGIEGKRALWTALRTAAEHVPVLRDVDYARLIERAEQQRRRAEVRRLQAATDAFGQQEETT